MKSTSKAELAQSIAEKADISKTAALRVIDALTSTITETLVEGGSVSLVGFGSFATKTRPAREGRNPKTGEPIQIEEAIVPSFKAGKGLKDAVNV